MTANFKDEYNKYDFYNEDDWEQLLNTLKNNPLALQFVDTKFRESYKFMNQAVKKNPNTLKFGIPEIRDNEKIVIDAVINDPRMLIFASPRLQKNKNILEIIEVFNDKNAFKNASDSIKNNEKLVFKLMNLYPENYKYIGQQLKENEKIAYIAITKIPENLNYADKTLQCDEEFILRLMYSRCNNIENAFPFVGKKLKRNKEFILKDLKRNKKRAYIFPKKTFFYYIDESLKKNKQFLLSAAEIAPELVFNLNKDLSNNFNFMVEFAKISYFNTKYASDTLKDNDEFIAKIILKYPKCFIYASDRLKNDEDYILKHINKTPEIIKYCSSSLKKNTDFISKVKNINTNYLEYFEYESFINDDMVLKSKNNSTDAEAIKKLLENIITKYPEKTLLLSERIRDDEEYMLSLIAKNPAVLSYVSDRLKNDINFNTKVLTKYPKATNYASECIQKNHDINIAILKENKSNLDYISDSLKRDATFIARATFECDNNIIRYIKNDYARAQALDILTKENKINQVLATEDSVYDLLTRDHYAFSHLSIEIRDTEKYAIRAIQHLYLNYKYISDRLKNDYKFNVKLLKETTSGGMSEFFVDKFKNNEELMTICIRRSWGSYNFLSTRLKNDPEFNAKLVCYIGDNISKYISQKITTNPIFINYLKENGIDVSKYEAIIEKQKNEIAKQERIYLKICKKFIEEKKSNPKLTKNEFISNKNISSFDFDNAINYIKEIDLTLYEYIKTSLKMNSQRYMHKKDQIIDKFFNDLKNGVSLNNGETRECNIIDFYNYFGRFGINCNMKDFKDFVSQPLDSDSVRTLRKFFQTNKVTFINYAQEYKGKRVYIVDDKQIEATLEQKKYVVYLMTKNNFPNDSKTYSLLLRALVKGRLKLEYGYLLDDENKDTNENIDFSENQDELIERVNQLIEAQANSTYTEDTTGSVKH